MRQLFNEPIPAVKAANLQLVAKGTSEAASAPCTVR